MNVEEKVHFRDRGWALIELKRQEEAIRLFTRALEFDAEDFSSLCGLSTAYYNLEKWEKALRYADSAILADPDNAWGFLRRSYVLEALLRREEALEAAQEAARLSPRDGDCLIRFAAAQRKCGDLEGAKQTAIRLMEVSPDSATSHIEMGLVCIAQERYQEAADANRKALEIDAGEAVAISNLAYSLNCMDSKEEALEFYFRAAQLNPESKNTLRNFEDLIEECGYLSLTEYLSARQDADLRERVAQRKACRARTQEFLSKKQYGPAADSLRQALLLLPDDSTLMAQLAETCCHLLQYEEALQTSNALIEKYPQEWRGYQWRAWALLRMSDQIAEIKRSAWGDLWDTLRQRLRKSEKPADAQRRMRQEALAAVREAVRLSAETTAPPLETLCIILRHLDLHAEGEQAAKRMIERFPDWWCSHRALARLYARIGRWQEAEVSYRKAVECSPDNAEAVNDLGTALSSMNRNKEALECFQRAVELDSDCESYRENVKRMTPEKQTGRFSAR